MALVVNRAFIEKRGSFSIEQLVLPHKQMDANAELGMVNDFLSSPTIGRSGILALPMKIGVIDPVVQVAVVLRATLLIKCHE